MRSYIYGHVERTHVLLSKRDDIRIIRGHPLNLNSPLLAARDEFKLWIRILIFAKVRCRNSKDFGKNPEISCSLSKILVYRATGIGILTFRFGATLSRFIKSCYDFIFKFLSSND